jgi:hypothetical protein
VPNMFCSLVITTFCPWDVRIRCKCHCAKSVPHADLCNTHQPVRNDLSKTCLNWNK